MNERDAKAIQRHPHYVRKATHQLKGNACRFFVGWVIVVVVALVSARGGTITVQPAGNQGFDLHMDGVLVARMRLAANAAIVADNVVSNGTGIFLSGLRSTDPLAVTFATNDFVSVTLPGPTNAEPVVRFKLTVLAFNTNHWLAMFPDGAAPFHFLTCALPTAQVWHQRGWLNATPLADPFPLLQDVHVGSPELSCLWNRNWGYICALGAHPIPMIGLWDPAARLYVGYDFQGARVVDQSERYLATAYCWRQGALTNFITLAFPYGGLRYSNQVYPQGGEVLASWFSLQIDPDLPSTEDPNERFQARLFARYTNALPRVPAMNDLGWVPGQVHLANFSGPIGLSLYGSGSETTFYPAGTILLNGWRGQQEMPIDKAIRNNDTATISYARGRVESLLTNYALTFTAGGDTCVYWQKPLSGSWSPDWGGAGVTTLHESEGWYAGRVLVELYRYDRGLGQAKPEYLAAIDGLFNWAKNFVWSRNEFADVPSSPFAIGGTLSTAFLLDYYFTFRNDPQRGNNATLALNLANRLTWRYLQMWAMDSDRFDGTLDSAFLIEPNSGRDWAGLGCANEVFWCIDSLTQVYVHTGDARLRYYLRGILQRWPALYQPNYAASIAAYGSDSFTEGLGLFDGSGPGRGYRYPFGSCQTLPLNDPVGNSTMRVIAGVAACIAFDRFDQSTDVTDYRTPGNGACSFRIISARPGQFDVSFSYPFVNISGYTVTRVRNGQTNVLSGSQITRPTQSPSSLYLSQMKNGDVITIGTVLAGTPTNSFDTSLVYNDANVAPVTNGLFATVPLTMDYPLPQDWNDVNSFAGIIPGLRWGYGVPYQQRLRAATNATPAVAPGANVVLVAYAPPISQALGPGPTLTLDDSSVAPLSGQPAPVWRGWPIIFNQMVLLDFAVVPNGRSLAQVNPNGSLVMGLTAFTGSLTDWQPTQTALTNASAVFVQEEMQRLAVLALRSSFATLPGGKIALLPLSQAGAAGNFAAATGLDQKWDVLTEPQLVDTNQFNAARYPLAFYLGSENYVKTVNTDGDGKTAVTRYLASGGTLVILATGPFPFYYGYGPNDQPGQADSLLPTYGLPFIGFEQPPAGMYMQRYTNQTILQSVPVTFPFPPGDSRLRAIDGGAVSTANRYRPLIRALYAQGTYYGDAAMFIAFGTGAANGGKILYVWSSLLSGPQGQAILIDTVSWIVNATLRPPLPSITSVLTPDSTHVAFQFTAQSNLDYVVQYRNSLSAGAWTKLQDLSSAPTNRSIWFTNAISGTSTRFYRLKVGP